MEKIMVLAKLWYDHADCFVAGLSVGAGRRRLRMCVRNCSCGCSPVHSYDEYGTDFSLEQLCSLVQRQTVPLFEKLCHPRPCQLEMEQVRMMTTGCKSTLSRKARGWQRRTPESEWYSHKPHQQTRAILTSTRSTTVAERDIG